MCTHYEAVKDASRYKQAFHVELPTTMGRFDMWPLYPGSFIRIPHAADSGNDAVPAREAVFAQWGLVPHWVKTEADAKQRARKLVNARSETVSTLPSFRDSWARGHRCIIPAEGVYEPDWRSGKAVATCIGRADGAPMGLAGLWSVWKAPTGVVVTSYTMLTINADDHSLMRNFHRPGEEKRMVVVLPEGSYDDWLEAPAARAKEFLLRYPSERLVTTVGKA